MWATVNSIFSPLQGGLQEKIWLQTVWEWQNSQIKSDEEKAEAHEDLKVVWLCPLILMWWWWCSPVQESVWRNNNQVTRSISGRSWQEMCNSFFSFYLTPTQEHWKRFEIFNRKFCSFIFFGLRRWTSFLKVYFCKKKFQITRLFWRETSPDDAMFLF